MRSAFALEASAIGIFPFSFFSVLTASYVDVNKPETPMMFDGGGRVRPRPFFSVICNLATDVMDFALAVGVRVRQKIGTELRDAAEGQELAFDIEAESKITESDAAIAFVAQKHDASHSDRHGAAAGSKGKKGSPKTAQIKEKLGRLTRWASAPSGSAAPKLGGHRARSFEFDHVFGPDTDTHELYEKLIGDLVAATCEGYNGTIFAYGQTASGKTHTMMGDAERPGARPSAQRTLF